MTNGVLNVWQNFYLGKILQLTQDFVDLSADDFFALIVHPARIFLDRIVDS